jgi:thiosulfate/3-mercaptopyruvate sulfurtransferase
MSPSPLSRLLRRTVIAVLFGLSLAGPALAEAIEPLVPPAWLKARLGTQNLVVLDIRSAIDGGGPEAFVKAHIPGAIHSDYDKAGWRVTRNGVPFMLPTLPELEKLIGELGIDEDSHVVVVPAGVHASDFGAATRVYWTLKVSGLRKISILDGGFAAWTAAGYATESGKAAISPAIFTATLDKSVLAELDEVQKIARDGGAALIDARPATYFAGKEKAPTVKAYGHIPGAVNIDHASLYDEKTNRLKPRTALAALLKPIPAGPVASYCNTGHWASVNWFVLSELLGRKDAKLFAGSMTEWSADAHRPVASSRTKWDDLLKALGRGT